MSWWPFKEWRRGSCLARCFYQMATWHYDYKEDVRAIVKNISEGLDHVQAQGYDEKKCQWRYLTMKNEAVFYGEDEFPDALIIKILTFKDLLQERVDAES